jgi:hypothetical protein
VYAHVCVFMCEWVSECVGVRVGMGVCTVYSWLCDFSMEQKTSYNLKVIYLLAVCHETKIKSMLCNISEEGRSQDTVKLNLNWNDKEVAIPHMDALRK